MRECASALDACGADSGSRFVPVGRTQWPLLVFVFLPGRLVHVCGEWSVVFGEVIVGVVVQYRRLALVMRGSESYPEAIRWMGDCMQKHGTCEEPVLMRDGRGWCRLRGDGREGSMASGVFRVE